MYIKVKVTPDAKKEKLEQKQEDLFELSVREKAKQNMANERVRELIARHFGIIKTDVRIISGHRSPSKIISIDK
ncbi:MAG: DUF167 domain-containing protein [Candidatus Paceibacteria bacterium]